MPHATKKARKIEQTKIHCDGHNRASDDGRVEKKRQEKVTQAWSRVNGTACQEDWHELAFERPVALHTRD
jgi:hypothetical protein